MVSSYKSKAEKYILALLSNNLSFINPNIITLAGLVVSVLLFILIVHKLYIIAILIYPLLIVDMIDGILARKYNKATLFGGFLDSTIDRISDFLLIASFAFGRLVRFEIVLCLLLVAFLTSYVRSRAELAAGGKITLQVGIIERPERLIIIFVSLIVYMLFPNSSLYGFNLVEYIFLLLIVLSTVTVLQRIVCAYKILNT